jgi:hypothetical protein
VMLTRTAAHNHAGCHLIHAPHWANGAKQSPRLRSDPRAEPPPPPSQSA